MLPATKDDPKQRRPDITTAKTHLGWEPRVPVRDGLAKAIAYFAKELAASGEWGTSVHLHIFSLYCLFTLLSNHYHTLLCLFNTYSHKHSLFHINSSSYLPPCPFPPSLLLTINLNR